MAPFVALIRQSSCLFLMRPDATLRLLVPKEGVAHYWQSDQKLPTMGSKTVDRGGKKTAETGTKTAETGTKNCETETKNWRQMRGGCRPKSASTEEVRSGWMGLLIETPFGVALVPMCQKWAQKSETLYSFSKTLTQINQVIHTVNCRCWDVRKQIALLCLCIGMLT